MGTAPDNDRTKMVRIFGLLLLVFLVRGEVRLSLDSSELNGTWIVENANKSIRTNGRVPGGVYTDLQDGGILNQSIFYRQNDHEYRWVSRDNWTYSRTFDVPIEFLEKQVINLVLHGVDTVADVVLNGQLLGSVDNMFVRYIFPVKTSLREKNNTLEVRLTSAITAAIARAASLPKPVLPDCVPDAYQGECHANKLRKMQASFSWDWGPAFPGAGIWKSVEIEALDVAVIRDLTVTTNKVLVGDESTWELNVTIYADLAVESWDGPIIGIMHKLDPSGKSSPLKPKSSNTKAVSGNFSYVGELSFIYDESEVDVWWPNGYGEQPLYELNVTFLSLTVAEDVIRTVRVGFRTVELVQQPISPSSEGLSFYFKVNGVPVFMKGSNWIPAHVLPELGYAPDTVRHLLTSARDAHMNMLRVWGGGVYESDLFYQIADELGIMIWQDMMFACAMYPTTEDFLQSVGSEVEQQVRRLQHHPSIAVWAGNNENEAALRGNWYGTNAEFDRYKAEYKALYVNTIKPIVNDLDKGRSYVVSSPSNGLESEDEDFVASNPYDALYGDVHYYNYVSDGWKSSSFPDTRFASEYGYQALPSLLSLQEVSQTADLAFSSQFSQLRQHHPGGYLEMQLAIAYQLPLPNETNSMEYFDKFVYFSQISQGMSTKTESEKYRRDRSKIMSDGKGNTMGALYWQLNDVWQAPTWASIEFNGRWKLLHYLAKKFFAPIIVSSQLTSAGDLNVFIVSDLMEDVPDVTLTINVMGYGSFVPRLSFSNNHTVVNSSSKLEFSSSASDLLEAAGCSSDECFFQYQLTRNGSVIADNIEYNGSLKKAFTTPTDVTVEVTDATNTSALLTVRANSVAPFVWLETESAGTFSDNGFTQTSESVTVTFQSRDSTLDFDRFKATLTVRDLTNDEPKNVFPSKKVFRPEVLLV